MEKKETKKRRNAADKTHRTETMQGWGNPEQNDDPIGEVLHRDSFHINCSEADKNSSSDRDRTALRQVSVLGKTRESIKSELKSQRSLYAFSAKQSFLKAHQIKRRSDVAIVLIQKGVTQKSHPFLNAKVLLWVLRTCASGNLPGTTAKSPSIRTAIGVLRG